MSAIIAISSYVARGAVGLRLVVPLLESRGFDVWGLPTIILANRPDLDPSHAGREGAIDLSPRLETFLRPDLLTGVGGIVTGYFAHADQVDTVARFVRNLKAANPEVHYLCDPVLGDDNPGLYVDPQVGGRVRDALVPLADSITPNRFELAWLSGGAVATRSDIAAAASRIKVAEVVVTSALRSPSRLTNMLVSSEGTRAKEVAYLDAVPKGTGDAFSAIYLAARLTEKDAPHALQEATRTMEAITRASVGQVSLDMRAAI